MTFSECCKNDGIEHMPLMVIRTTWRPSPFKAKTGAELGFDYHASKTAWTTKELLFGWLTRLDSYSRLTAGRKILLLVDDFFAHGKKKKFSPLQNIRVEFLPPSTASNMQPLDAGILDCVKAKYKHRMLFRDFENLDVGKKSIYNVGILTALPWTYEKWDIFPAYVV